MNTATDQLQNKRVELLVSGTDCPACVAKVEKCLRSIDGVDSAVFIPGTGRLRISYDPRMTSLKAMDTVLTSIGHPVCSEMTGSGTDRSGFMDGVAHWLIGNWPLLLAAVGLALGVVLGLFDRPDAAKLCYGWAILVGGVGPARAGWQSLRRGLGIDMNILMVVAALGAAMIGEWAEGATVVFLFAVGEALEGFTVGRARRAIQSLVSLVPDTATVLRGGGEEEVPASAVLVGEIVVVRPGARIPLDGTIVRGRSALNQAPITGESMPVFKGPGEQVFAGSVNGEGALEVQVQSPASDSTLARIARLVEEAGARKARVERFVDRFARRYTPMVLVVAALVMVAPPLFLGLPWLEWFYRGLAVLLIACPCALVLSTPVAISAAIAAAARRGVLIKGGAYLEALGSARVIAFDKTGTLTRGRAQVTDVIPLGGRQEGEVLAIAASVEARSEHSVADAIRRRARSSKLAFLPGADFIAIPGLGARAKVGGEDVYVGNPRLAVEQGYSLTGNLQGLIAGLEQEGKTPILVAGSGSVLGVIAVADEVRPSATAAVSQLKDLGLRVVMLTGDNARTARAVADRLGIDDYRAGLLPEDKLAAVRTMERQDGRLAMVGDGINDAPALAAATVGIAMGAGTDAALETADIALIGDDPAKIPLTVKLSRAARGVVGQNVAIALAIKIAAFALVFPGLLTLWMAVMADTGAAVVVVANSMRLLSASRQAASGTERW